MLAIGCDHGGFALMNSVKGYLDNNNIQYIDFGVHSDASVDYAPIAYKVANAVSRGDCGKGILICGTGIGMSLAANKVKGIRAAVCSESYSCKYTRLHNNANILCLGGRVVDESKALELVDIFLNTEFEGGRHQRRINQIAAIENGEEPFDGK